MALQYTQIEFLIIVALFILQQILVDRSSPNSAAVQNAILLYPSGRSCDNLNFQNILKSKSKISFINLIEENPLKILVIYNFLAILELIQESKVKLSLGQGLNNFWIKDLS